MTTTLTEAEQFFYDHAGYSYDAEHMTGEQGRILSAKLLAQAEEWAKDHDLTYVWVDTDDWTPSGHESEFGYTPETCEFAELVNEDGETLASLGCIDDATPEYRRVIEAELAFEANGNYYTTAT
jgi:hypothetical protein